MMMTFAEAGTSDYPCSEIYTGEQPFSEPETLAVSNWLLANNDDLLVYMTLHSYGQFILTPWGYGSELPDDYDDLVSQGASKL